MTEYKMTLHEDAKKLGYQIFEEAGQIIADGIPYRRENGEGGKCRVIVFRDPATGIPSGVPKHPPHTARVDNVEGGVPYNKQGDPVGAVINREANACVLSIKKGEQQYPLDDDDAWEQLWRYVFYVSEGAHTTRAWVEEWEKRIADEKIILVGVGGTGTYLVDALSRAGVSEIEIWDGDTIEERNGRRGPGPHLLWREAIGKNKAETIAEWYGTDGTAITAQGRNWTRDDADKLEGAHTIFTAVDDDEARQSIHDAAKNFGIPVIDVGLGIRLEESELTGSFQSTVIIGEDEGRSRLVGDGELVGARQQYRNLALPELHAMNAAMAIIMWRRLKRQYPQGDENKHLRYDIDWDRWILE